MDTEYIAEQYDTTVSAFNRIKQLVFKANLKTPIILSPQPQQEHFYEWCGNERNTFDMFWPQDLTS
jgi:hypothetical protein